MKGDTEPTSRGIARRAATASQRARSRGVTPRRALGGVALFLLAFCAHAHRLSPAYFGLTESEPQVFDVEWKVSIPGGLADVLEPQVPAGCAIRGGVRSYLVDDARLQLGVIECDGGLAGREVTVNGLASTDTDVLVRVAWLDDSSFTHRLVPGAPSVVVPERASGLAVATTYFVLGVEHILLGIDHLLFVLALLLLVDGIGRLVATVTAFTLAHSVTLGAATLGFVDVPSAPVEATIALSILFLASELARGGAAAGFARGPAPALQRALAAEPAGDLTRRFPWFVAFAFGLLHGFGFAGALSEVVLPQHAIPLALLFFNLGVEVGQLAFIAGVLGLAWAWRRVAAPAPAWWPRAAAYAIGSVAAFWTIERTVGVLS
jgi:hydrogenase/urease accessory protein HupE